MDTILHIPDLLQHVFEFLIRVPIIQYSDLPSLLLVNKSFSHAVHKWPEFLKCLSLGMNSGSDMVCPTRRSARHPQRVSYGALNVIQQSAGKLVHLKLGNINLSTTFVLTNRHLGCIVESSPRLRTLYIYMRTKLTTRGMGVLNQLGQLRTLELPLEKRVAFPTFDKITKLCVYGTHTTRLEENMVHIQPSVRTFHLQKVRQLSETVIRSLSTLFPNVVAFGAHRCFTKKLGHSCCIEADCAPIEFFTRLVYLHLTRTNVVCLTVFSNHHTFSRMFPRVAHLTANKALSDSLDYSRCGCVYRETGEYDVVLRCTACMGREYSQLRTIVLCK